MLVKASLLSRPSPPPSPSPSSIDGPVRLPKAHVYKCHEPKAPVVENTKKKRSSMGKKDKHKLKYKVYGAKKHAEKQHHEPAPHVAEPNEGGTTSPPPAGYVVIILLNILQFLCIRKYRYQFSLYHLPLTMTISQICSHVSGYH